MFEHLQDLEKKHDELYGTARRARRARRPERLPRHQQEAGGDPAHGRPLPPLPQGGRPSATRRARCSPAWARTTSCARWPRRSSSVSRPASPSSRSGCARSSSPRTPTTTATWCSRSAPAPAATRPACSRRALPHVLALRRAPGLPRVGHRPLRVRRARHQGGLGDRRRPGRVEPAQVRGRRPPRAARARDRSRRAASTPRR